MAEVLFFATNSLR